MNGPYSEATPSWMIPASAVDWTEPVLVERSAIVVVINALAVLGSTFLIVLFFYDRGLRNVPNYLVLNLAVADLALSVTHLSVNATLLATGAWSYGLCQYSGWSATFFGGVSLSSLGVMAFERFAATVKESPLRPRQVAFMVAGVWLWNGWLAAIPWALQQEYRPEPSRVYCMSQWTTRVPAWATFAAIVILQIASVAVTISTSYYAIYHKVVEIKKLLKSVRQHNTESFSYAPPSSVMPPPGLPTSPGMSMPAASTMNTLSSSVNSPLLGESGRTVVNSSVNGGGAGGMAVAKSASLGATGGPPLSSMAEGPESPGLPAPASMPTTPIPPRRRGSILADPSQPAKRLSVTLATPPMLTRPAWWNAVFGPANELPTSSSFTMPHSLSMDASTSVVGNGSGTGQEDTSVGGGTAAAGTIARTAATTPRGSGALPDGGSPEYHSKSGTGRRASISPNDSVTSGLGQLPSAGVPPGQDTMRKKASSFLRSLPQFRRRRAMEEKKLETVLFRKAIIITGTFCINWLPYMVSVAYQFISDRELPAWFHVTSALGIYINSATDPLLCLVLDTRWLRSMREILGLVKDDAYGGPSVARTRSNSRRISGDPNATIRRRM
ncbi:hypothetical protein H9P43_002725 [Blastocladiella emersonii ATCC 22665]|nr:hypothetical protein H9P43_002725 [Blastocladiella emersonii ATCC 22665]